uniref:hypothetical protein n=1 Tax=Bordetella sputigena TaxID=1416810 RepID=UPI0039F0797F
MTTLLATLDSLPPLCRSLRNIADEGFNVKDECYFLAALLRKADSVTRSRFFDSTGYECFVNSLHIEDYDDKAPLAQAIQFISYVFAMWRTAEYAVPLVAVVNVDEGRVIVKFHAKRSTEQWLSGNLEAYGDPTMSVQSLEDLAVFLASLRSGG